ncbi:hypothetical protein GOODEAATRI_025223 [Goodea atripinnis]|uniref:Uncharacterized protein n=1 Tax=Goodea atripinnis TaxID=208336 RepID=A0ABV0P7M8_9TELE
MSRGKSKTESIQSSLLSHQENEKLEELLGRSPSMWSLQHTGVVCFIKDNPQRSYYIRMDPCLLCQASVLLLRPLHKHEVARAPCLPSQASHSEDSHRFSLVQACHHLPPQAEQVHLHRLHRPKLQLHHFHRLHGPLPPHLQCPPTACHLLRHLRARIAVWVSLHLLYHLYPAGLVEEGLHLLPLHLLLHLLKLIFLQISPLLLRPVAHHNLLLHPSEKEKAEEPCLTRSESERI